MRRGHQAAAGCYWWGKQSDDMADMSVKRGVTPRHPVLEGVLQDPVLVSAFVVCALLIGYQLSVTLLQPPWIKPVTDWLRSSLAWPQAAVVAWVAVVRLFRTHQPDAVAWCCLALGMLSYAIARTTWTIADIAIYPHGVPFPSLPDLFFILQYPCFVAALFLFHARDRWLPGVRFIVDGLLWVIAVTALSWYFVLLPLSLQTREPPLSKYISIYYQIFDLVIFYGLVMALTRTRRTIRDLMTMSLLSLAVISLFVADTWAALLLIHPTYTYRTGSPPDLFWFICYLLIPLVSLVRLRVVPAELSFRPPAPVAHLSWQDALTSIKLIAPSAAVVVAGLVIMHADVASPRTTNPSFPTVVGIALLLLATLRPGVVFLEHEQLRRERDAALAQERALRLANAYMESSLSVVAHELKTPLTSLIANVHLMPRRLDTLLTLVRNHESHTDTASALYTLIQWSDRGLERMRRLVEDVLDETRVREGRLALRFGVCDLVSVVGQAVTEQQALNPERTIHVLPEASPILVLADAGRIEQVVTNYVSNALKFSRSGQPVDVRVQTDDGRARVSVHDDGAGVPMEDQLRIWERFYQAERVDVQSGSQVGFGIGLYVSRAIIEGHHGQVGIESAPGRGTTVWFKLPLMSPPATSSPKAEAGDYNRTHK
jgi:signal transduction histidine kinase